MHLVMSLHVKRIHGHSSLWHSCHLVTLSPYHLCHRNTLSPYHLTTCRHGVVIGEGVLSYLRITSLVKRIHGHLAHLCHSYHLITLPPYPPFHLVTLSPYHLVTLAPYHLITLSPCHPVTFRVALAYPLTWATRHAAIFVILSICSLWLLIPCPHTCASTNVTAKLRPSHDTAHWSLLTRSRQNCV